MQLLGGFSSHRQDVGQVVDVLDGHVEKEDAAGHDHARGHGVKKRHQVLSI
jgi:hypothetical protein